uniref:FoP_duplication domain-containing protein n=2 Tax=Bursaphelenchus xylophilus TaxID=6326 RepID=A0A1I7S0X7_BURXY
MSDKTELALGDIIKANKENRQKRGGAQKKEAKKLPVQGGVAKKERLPSRPSTHNNRSRSSSRPVSKDELEFLRLGNIPSNVSERELASLFHQYKQARTYLHHDSRGRSLGTGEIRAPQGTVDRIRRDFSGVLIDKRPLDIRMVTSSKEKISERITVAKKSKSKPKKKKNVARKGGKITAEELDKELEQYMTQKKEEKIEESKN